MNFNKQYKLYFIHHSHTDIGYTHRPQEAINKQVNYIYDVMKYLDDISQNDTHDWQGFKWNCETFVVVDHFLKTANEANKNKFAEYIKSGKIGFSYAYANMSELIAPSIMDKMIKRAKQFISEYGISTKSAMQADVNGFSLGYAESLASCGVDNYLAFVHTHHGMYPLFRKHTPFYWQLPSGKKLLVFNGEHYMFGNSFGFCDGAITQYGFGDDEDFEKYNKANDDSWMELCENRLAKYINALEESGWENDYLIQGIHGKFTDNSMPNPSIAKRINDWNAKHGDKIFVEMVTLDEAFEVIKESADIPVYSGDWPDWWTDGVGSSPRELKIFKNTQSKYQKLLDIASLKDIELPKPLLDEIEYDLTLFSEHTYGSWDSISNPYHAFTHEQWSSKQWFVFDALKKVDDLETLIKQEMNDQKDSFNIVTKWEIINSSNHTITETIKLPYEYFDTLSFSDKFNIMDQHDKVYDYVLEHGIPIINVTITPKQSLLINVDYNGNITPKTSMIKHYHPIRGGGSDGVDDVNNILYSGNGNGNYRLTNSSFENDFYEIKWNKTGIYYIYDKTLNCNIIDESHESTAFCPVYEVTPNTPRNMIGRNRKGFDVKRDFGILTNVEVTNKNYHYVSINFNFTVSGCSRYTVELTIDNTFAKISSKVLIDKELEKLPESLYIALPFGYESSSPKFSKETCLSKPRKDQIPGTLTDFYSVFDGVVFGEEKGFVITTPDTQLIQVGDLEFKDRILYGDEKLKDEKMNLYVWAMNNIWETNFILNLANFYEFNYIIKPFGSNDDPLNLCKACNHGLTIVGR